MALSIKLYAHGVPKGQKIWGATGMVGKYIETFYHPYTYEEQMYVETKNIDGTPYCFYTFIKGKTVLDYEGRAGAYLALTLQINAFYVDIQNIYNILSAAYKKMCIGSCVKENGGNVKFCISDFSQVNDQLQTIENKAIGYIGDFSNNDDLKGIGTSQNSTTEINLQECTKDVATALIGRGKIVVSPLIPSSNEKAIIDKKNKEIEAVRKDAQRQIDTSKQEAQQRIEAVKKEKAVLQQNLQVIDDKHKKELDNLRSKHKRELEEKLADSVKKIGNLSKEKANLQHSLRQAEDYYKKQSKELDKLRQQIVRGGQFGEPISPYAGNGGHSNKGYGIIDSLKHNLRPIFLMVAVLFALGLLTICVRTAFGCSREDASENSVQFDESSSSESEKPEQCETSELSETDSDEDESDVPPNQLLNYNFHEFFEKARKKIASTPVADGETSTTENTEKNESGKEPTNSKLENTQDTDGHGNPDNSTDADPNNK